MLKPLTLSLSCSLPHALLLLRLLLLKQTNRRISTDDVLLQAASFNGRRMAFARDPSLSTVHTSNHEILLVDVHATNKQLRTVQHACMRASLFSLANSANVRMCFIETEIWNGRKVVNTPGNISDMFSGDASHSRRLFFQPGVGSLPSARHCSHVFGFLKSNLPFLPARNCVRGKVRSHTWHVSGFAAASLDLCSFIC